MTNVGSFDRAARATAGVALAVASLVAGGSWRWLCLGGAVLALTALVRFCPAYWLLRIRTSARPGTGRSAR